MGKTQLSATPTSSSKLYRAFVSYSHKDKIFGRWLHNRLETYRFPKQHVGQQTERGVVGPRLGRMFRDEADAGAADSLKSLIEHALSDARDLVVICSPAAAQSPWVDKEIRYFKANRPDGQVFAVILEGTPNTNDPATECFPPALKVSVGKNLELLPDQPEEPLAANVAADGREDAALRLLAGLSGLTFNDLRDREVERVRRQRRRAAVTMTAALALIALAGVGLTLASVQTWRNETSRSKLLAVEAERALDNGESDRAILLLLAASPARKGHFGPGFADFPETEALLARAALETRLERDIQLPDKFPGILQYRGDRLSVLQGSSPGEFSGRNIVWSEAGDAPRRERWSLQQEFQGYVAFGRYGGPVAMADGETLQLRDPQTGRAGPPITLPVHRLAASDDGAFFAAYTDANRLIAFRTKPDLTLLEFFNRPWSEGLDPRIAISHDGKYAIVVSDFVYECVPLDGARGRGPRSIEESDPNYYSAAFAPTSYDARWGPAYAISQEGTPGGGPPRVSLRTCGHYYERELGTFPVRGVFPPSVQFSQDGRTLLTAEGGQAQLWDVSAAADGFSVSEAPQLVAELTGLANVPHDEGYIFSPDGAHVAALDINGRLRIWNARYGDYLGGIESRNTTHMAPLPNGDGVALVETDAGLWRLERGVPPRRIATFPRCETAPGEGWCTFTRIVAANRGPRIVLVRSDGWIGAADVESGALVRFQGAAPEPRAAAMTAGGTAVLFNSTNLRDNQRTASFWNAQTGERIDQRPPPFDFRAEIVNPAGALVAGIAVSGGQLVLADARTGQRLATADVTPHSDARYTLSFSQNGEEIFGARDGAQFRFGVRRTAAGFSLDRITELRSTPWQLNAGAIDPVTWQRITPDYAGTEFLSPDALTLFVLERGRSVRAFDLPPRGQGLIEDACSRLSPDRSEFTAAEMKTNPLLRSDDRRPCERAGLLSLEWWIGLARR